MDKMEGTPIDLGKNEKPLTLGEQLVGLKFNPAGDSKVDKLKRLFAKAADMVEEFRQEIKNGPYDEQQDILHMTVYMNAMQNILAASMAAVKVVTLKIK